MTIFDRDLAGYRYVEIEHGDTLQKVAFRELGDAARWNELIWINNLVPPYITDDVDLASNRVLLSGGLILVPSGRPVAGTTVDPNRVFDSDCRLRAGLLDSDEGGDLFVVSGMENLKQQLAHRIMTDRGQLMFHPEYGCDIRRILGVVNGVTASLLAANYAKAALMADDRVAEVVQTDAEIVGELTNLKAEIRPISGRAIDIQTVI